MAGLFTVFFILAAAVALWWFSGSRELTETYILETRGNVTGLNLEAQVRYRGIRAGKVRDIRADELDPGVLLVEVSVASRYRLTDRTVARLNFQGITGLAYVMLEEGKEGKGTLLDVSGPTPPRIRIHPGLLDKLGDKAGDIAGQVAELSVRLNRLLDDRNVENIGRTLDNLAAASESMKEAPRVMAALRAALSDANLKRLGAVLAHLEKTAGETAPLTAEARQLVGTLNGLARRLDGVTSQAGERLTAETLPRAEALMSEVTVATRRLDRLLDTLNDTPQAVLFGTGAPQPGPGEAGFAAPRKEK
jgi:phospholipid/cholesterol/gamma-HCH transport system substrate-binding protein